MTTRAMGPLAGLDWLKRGINLGRNNPKAVFGGAALLSVVALLPSVLQALVQFVVQPGEGGMLAIMALSTLLSIVLMPPLIGGYLRLIDAAEHGRPVSAGAVLAPFRSGGDAGRLIGFGLLLTLVYLALAFAVIALAGKGILDWYLQVLELTRNGQAAGAGTMPPLPEGLGTAMALGSLVAIFLSGVYAIGFGQVALGGRGIGAGLADGVLGTVKNLLPLLLLAVLSIVLLIVVMLVLGLVVGLLMVIGGLVHPVLGAALALPVYFAFLLAIYVVMFGVMYYLWRDVAGQAPTQVATPGHVEL